MPPLTAYELERQENIRRNQEVLQSLGIFQAVPNKRKANVSRATRPVVLFTYFSLRVLGSS